MGQSAPIDSAASPLGFLVAQWLSGETGAALQIPVSFYSDAAVEELYPEVLRLARENLTRAGELAAEMLTMASHLGQARPLGLALRASANVHYLRGNYAQARSGYEEAIAQFHAESTAWGEEEVARTKSSAIQTLAYLARYDEAIAWGEEARTVFAARGDAVRLARLDGNLANLYFRLDRFEEALVRYETARQEFERSGAPQDLAAIYSNLATCCISVGRFEDSLHWHRTAREVCIVHRFPLLAAQADYNIAYLHFLRGDNREAMRLYAIARIHSDAVADRYHSALCDLDQAEMMLDLNLFGEAERLAASAVRAFGRLKMRYERAKAMVFHAAALAGRGEAEESILLFRRTRRLFFREGNRAWPAFIDLHLGLLDLEIGSIGRAARRAQRSWRFFAAGEVRGKAVLAALVLCRVRMRQKRFAEAEVLSRRSLADAGTMGSPSLCFRARMLLGLVLEAQGRGVDARATYEAAEAELDSLRLRIPEEELRIRFLEDKTPLFERLVSLRLRESGDPGQVQAAWASVQNAKSRAFLDSYGSRFTDRGAGREDRPLRDARAHLQQCYLRSAEAELRGEMKEVREWRTRTAVAEAAVRERLSQLRLYDAEGSLVEEWPPVAKEAASAELAVRQAIGTDELLIEYYCTPESVYAFLLDGKADLVVHRLAATAEVRTAARLLQFQISSSSYRTDLSAQANIKAITAHLATLYRLLVHPLRSRLTVPRLVFAPHSFLHGLPFAALGPAGSPLVGEFAIRQTLSGSTFAAIGRRPLREASAPARRPLVLGLPDERAPFIADEARLVAQHLDADLRLGPEATLAALRDIGRYASHVHIATHGLFRADSPLFSGIRLADGNLSVMDLSEVQMAAHLVTLSGCSTGSHAVLGGDELIGLSRGFLQAGAENLLTTLWDVNDASTMRFMDLFYEQLRAGGSLSDSLRRAMLQVRQEWVHPYYWAGFALLGGEASPGT
jgi:CHAT domain-containing protein